METRYKHIYFERGLYVWICKNRKSKEELGHIEFYRPWKQHVFQSAGDFVVFSVDCLADIQHFMGQLKEGESQ